MIEYHIIGDTKASLLHCFLSISKLKAGDIITTGHYMNYQTISNLQFRPLLKNSFHSIHIDSRDTSGEKIPFVYVGIARFVFMFRKASNFHFQPERRYKMVASGQVEIPFCRGIDRQRGRRFDALAQDIGRTAIPFLRNFIVPAEKGALADLLEFAVPEIAEVVSGRKRFKTAAKCVRRQTLRKQSGSGSRKRTASGVIPTKSAEQISRSRETFHKQFSSIMSNIFRYQLFEAVSGSLGKNSQ